MILKLSDSAKKDLQAISAYTIEHWGYGQEDKYLDQIYSRFEATLADPSKSKERDELYAGARSVTVEKHIIFFKIQGDTLLVARILHQSMDFIRHLDGTHFEEL